ncbi:MAG TPA: DUF1254 domain-containing protein [Candidatus Polarisedimenticolaceae bacterium]|nr:DUF1254 domain-containing protein [Candidatus Polarisedimenticolaceae bacterium]
MGARVGSYGVSLSLSLAIACAPGGRPEDGAEVEALAEQAYLYGIQQVRFYGARFDYTQNETSDVYAGINRFSSLNDGRSIPAEPRAIVRTDVHTIEARAFLDLRHQPLVLETPEVADRYFSLQLMDAYGVYFFHAGSQWNGAEARRYLLLPAGWQDPPPSGFPAINVIHAPANSVLAVLRLARKDPSDPAEVAEVNRLRSLVTITPLGEWSPLPRRPLDPDLPPIVPGDYPSAPRPEQLTPRPLERQTAEEFFNLLHLVLNDTSLARIADSTQESEMLNRLAAIGVGEGLDFDWAALDARTRRALESGFARGFSVVRRAGTRATVDFGGWKMLRASGRFRTDWLARAVTADFDWAGPDRDGSHATAVLDQDADGRRLDGRQRYTLRLSMGRLPPVTEFWSIAIYDDAGRLVDNELGRHAVTSFMLDARELAVHNGELRIQIQHARPSDSAEAANWLPAPTGPFRLVARYFGPYTAVFNGAYRLPPVQRRLD